MIKEMDLRQALRISAFDLEGGTTGGYNLGKYFTKALDEASTSAVLWFGSQALFLPFAMRKPTGYLAKDEYKVHDGMERLRKTLRYRAKEYYVEALLKVLTVGVDQVPEPDEVGYIIACDYVEELEGERKKRCKTK